MENEKEEIDITNAQCANCGSGLYYYPEKLCLKCKSCSSVFNFPKSKTDIKKDFINSSVRNEEWSHESRVFHCDTCGAKIIITGYNLTTVCPYCGSTYVSKTEELPGLKPNRVIPFDFDEAMAAKIFQRGVRKKFFVPRVFKKCLPENKVRGIYIPTFTFDSNTSSSYSGVLEKVTTTRDSKGNVHRNVKRFNISGTKGVNFRDLVIESSNRLDQRQLNSLLPFNMDNSFDFDYNFLRGYSVEHYIDSLDTCFSLAKGMMDNEIKGQILSGYNYTSVVSLYINTNYNDKKYSYLLLPIYTFEYTYNGRVGNIVSLEIFKQNKVIDKISKNPVFQNTIIIIIFAISTYIILK